MDVIRKILRNIFFMLMIVLFVTFVFRSMIMIADMEGTIPIPQINDWRFSCEEDSDCVAVDRDGCCSYVAVNKHWKFIIWQRDQQCKFTCPAYKAVCAERNRCALIKQEQ